MTNSMISAGSGILGVTTYKWFGGDLSFTYLVATAALMYGMAAISAAFNFAVKP